MTRTLVVKCTTTIRSPARRPSRSRPPHSPPARRCLCGSRETPPAGGPGQAEAFVLPKSAPLAELRDAVLAEGTLTVCTQCAARRGLTAADLLPGVRLAGAATFVDEILAEGAQAVVYGAG